MALIRRGKQAVKSAFRAHSELQTGQLAKASNTLSDVKIDGIRLAKEAVQLMNRIEATENHIRRKEQALCREIGRLGAEEQTLKDRKRSIEKELERKRSELRDQRQSLEEAEDKLSSAMVERQKAKKNKNKAIAASVGLGIGGVIFSVATLGLGTPIAVAGVVVGAVVADSYADEQKSAEREIEQHRQVIHETESNIESCTKQISQITSSIYSLAQQIEEQQQKAKRYHAERGEMKELIAFVKEAQSYWDEFANATKHGAGRAELIQKLTKKAQEKRWFGFFARRTGKRQAMNFLEAWEDVKTKLESGSEHLFEIDFECSYCSRTFRSLPYVHNSKLICSACHYYYR